MTISVVIPLYNQAPYVERALRSVLSQTCQPDEIIVVDDGSSDGGSEIAARLADSRIRLVRQCNAGVSAARNQGIALAGGRLIAFLDADDEWLPQHLQAIASLAQSHPQCDVFGTSYVVRTGRGPDRSMVNHAKRKSSGDKTLDDYFAIASRSDPPFCSSSVAVTRPAIQWIGGFEPGIAQGEDLLTWARLAARFQIAYTDHPSAIVWQPHFDGPVPTRRPEANDHVGPALSALLPIVPPSAQRSLRRYIALWHKMRGSMYLKLGDRVLARREFNRALRFHFASPRLLSKYLMTFLPTGMTQQLLVAWVRATRRTVRA